MKSLPIGISTFRFLIEDDMVYVDKTGIIQPLVSVKGRYFLSRPRRFGKSLLVDTLKELFEGNESLFRGLAIYDSWDWSKEHAVLKIDFTGGTLRSKQDLADKLMPVLNRQAERYGVSLTARGVSNRLHEVIQTMYEATGNPIVVLVDEYDKPLLDNIESPRRAMDMRDALRDLYSPLKELDGLLQFVFLTGVTKFSKVNIFSGINNLKDITLDPNYASICGYTQGDLETDFVEHLEGVDWTELREWYNGYNFLGETVYNPFDILLFISENMNYRNFWFETGTPTFMIRLLQKNRYFLPDLEEIEVSDEEINSFDVDRIPPSVLLFQSGYLTIEESFRKLNKQYYRLRIPNQEVASAFSDALLGGYTEILEQRSKYQTDAFEALSSADMPGLERAVRRLFAGIPWQNFTNNDIAEYEGYYASVLYAFFVSISCTVLPEDTSNHGQADLTVILKDTVCVMEIKTVPNHLSDEEGNPALEQVKAKGYADKYTGQSERTVFEIGLVFSRKERNISRFDFNRHT